VEELPLPRVKVEELLLLRGAVQLALQLQRQGARPEKLL